MLRRLGHIDGEDVVQLKGRAACELDTADELLATELMFNGVFPGPRPPTTWSPSSRASCPSRTPSPEVRRR